MKSTKALSKKILVLLSLFLMGTLILPLSVQAVRPQISAGGAYTVGLKSDGSVIAVGNNKYGQCNVSNWKDIIQVSAGSAHTVGLKKDGTVVAVGMNKSGQCNVESWKDIIQVAAGRDHTVGLKSDGSVVAVGWNGDGRCNVSNWTDIMQVSAGELHTVGLKTDGTVVAVGSNGSGRCNVGSWKDIIQVSAGSYHTVGLKSDGTVVAVGWNKYGQCDVSNWTNIIQVAAGFGHTEGLKSDGTVVTVEISWKDIIQVSAGSHHTVGLKSDGSVVAFGYNGGECDVSDWDLIKGAPPTNQPPIVFFIYSSESPGVDDEITFDASASSDLDGEIVSYEWDFGDDSTGDGKTVTHSYPEGGSYEVTLTVTDDGGKEATLSKQITVTEKVGGPIAIDVTWTEDNSPYIVVQHIEVAEDATLTIEPGVTVKFEDYALMIRGALVARGTMDKMITFTSNQDSPEPVDWKGIQFKDLSVDATFDENMNYVSGSILEYCKVEFANTAISGDSASPFVNHCSISNNYRGIVLSSKDVSPFINYSSITNSNIGIDLSCEGDASPIIDGCSISNNDNGGIYISSEDAVTVSNSIITGNITEGWRGYYGGGVHVSGGTITISDNTVTGNKCDRYGGGIYVSGGNVTIDNNTVTENTVKSYCRSFICIDAPGGYGGGIYASGDSVTIDHNIIDKNTARSDKGGGIYASGDTVTISNNIVTDNKAGRRGSIYVPSGAEAVTISDNTVTGNESCGIYLEGKAIVEKNLISNNTGVGINAEGELDISHNVITQNTGVGVEIRNENVVVNYCNFYGNEYAVRNNTGSEINAKNNWWSTTDALRINQKIYDFFDKENLGKVLYNPFLMSPDTDAPVIAPVGLTATPEGTMINLTWKPIELDDLAGYKIYYDSDSEEPPFEGTDATEGKSPIDVGKVTSFKLSGLRPETKYYITVTAYDTQGNEGWYAEIVTAETAEGELNPPLPTELSSPDDGAVIDTYTPILRWSASERATSYSIQIAKDSQFSEKEIDQSGITDVQYDVPPDNLKNLETYYWRVNATNSAGTSDWSEVRVFTVISGPSFTISLATGLNFVSLPMKPDVPYTARTFAEKLDSTVIIRYDAPSQKFVPYVPEVSETDGFVIEGGQGYIVNVLEEKQVTFTGTLWTNTPPASPKQTPDKENAVWAFVVAGNLPIELRNSGNLTLSVRNVERNIHREFQPSHSEFSVAFVNPARTPVVKAKDVLEISVKDADGRLVAQKQITVKPKDLAKAFVIVNPRYNPIPKSSVLLQNYPNPFNPETWIPFKLAEQAETSILIYDVAGRIIRTLRLGQLPAGVYTSKDRAAYWDGRDSFGDKVSSGVYFYQFQAGEDFTATKKLVILK